MVVAIEYPGKVEELFNENFLARGGSDYEFWKEVAKIIKRKGGIIKTIDNSYLYIKNYNATNIKEEFEKIKLERTVEFVGDAKKAKADFLVCGIHHAFDIKKLLGKRANVIFLTPQKEMKEFIERARFLREQKAIENKELLRRASPATRKPRPIRF
ncbi:MAG: hypothetical protein Q7S21_04370 [archaeon]|nr:hypothetical protein [archaeon]